MFGIASEACKKEQETNILQSKSKISDPKW